MKSREPSKDVRKPLKRSSGVDFSEASWPAVVVRISADASVEGLKEAMALVQRRLASASPFGLVFAFVQDASPSAAHRKCLSEFFQAEHEALSRLVQLCCIVASDQRAQSMFVRLGWSAPIPFEVTVCASVDQAIDRIQHAVAVQTSVNEERRRISRELHDGLGATLSALVWRVERCQRRGRVDQAGLEELAAMARQSLQELRLATMQIERAPMRLERWFEVLRQVVTSLVQYPDFALEMPRHRALPEWILGDVAHDLLRIVQEAVRNAVRHGGAKKVKVQVDCSVERLQIAVVDDGTGFSPAAVASSHSGLRNIRERVTRYGGIVDIKSRHGGGASLTIEVQTAKALCDQRQDV
jgi:signal transduction histidine kinase